MIILNVRFGRELLVITASISTTDFGGERLRQQPVYRSQPKSFLKQNYRLKGPIKTSLAETKIL